MSEQQAWALYPPDPARRYETPMLAYSLAFYACYGVALLGWLPLWFAGPLGVLLLLRYFNRFHELLHADVRGNTPWHPAHTALIVMGPIYLGYRQLRIEHLLHHREEGSPLDPDVAMLHRSPLVSLLWCFLQPELSWFEHVRRVGLRREVLVGTLGRLAVWTVLMLIGGWTGFVLYNVMTRVGNTLAWFVFGWVVHGSWLWGQVRPPRFPGFLARIWVVLIGWENLVGIRFHFLHHVFPHIPDRHLPEVSRRLAFD